MAEDKEEGEVLRTSGGSSVEEEGNFGGGLDGQISTIEDQLQRAQATLFELQTLKGKLEAERQHNLHREKDEQEIREAERIRRENERLRHELKEYHGEIGSLKEIISSLKDDLVKTAEKLEHKVNRTLHSLGEEEIHEHKHLPHHETAHEHEKADHHKKTEDRKDHNFFNDHIDKSKDSDKKPEEPGKQKIPEIVPNQPEEQKASVPNEGNIPVVNSQPAPIETGPELQKQEVAAPAVQAPASENAPIAAQTNPVNVAEHLPQDPVSEPAATQAAIVTEIDKVAAESQATAEDLLDEDLDEYEEIKRELEALENESIFKVSTPAQNTQPEQNQEVAGPEVSQKTESETGEKEKNGVFAGVTKLFSHKKKEQEATPQNNPASPDLSAVTEQPVQETPAPIQQVEAQPETPVAAQPPQAQPEAEKPKLSALSEVFKHKKRKIKGKINDGRDHEDHPKSTGGIGKLAATAAVVIAIVAIGGIAYKIKNAENLRQMYTLKAQDNVTQGNANTINEDVPDEFANSDPEKKYKEAYADYPFAETVWVNYRDPEMGITVDYPQNTSYRLKPVGSDNLWFLRKNGYLLKIEKITTPLSLGEIRDQITTNVKYASESVVVRGNSTIHLVLQEDLPVKGNIYLTNVAGATYKIWYKTFQAGENPDDEQRVKKMLDTLDFISSE